MTLTYTFPVRCFLCGHIESAMVMGWGARVNKATVRIEQSLTALIGVCRECGSPMPHSTAPRPITWTAESAEKIATARRKKGWA